MMSTQLAQANQSEKLPLTGIKLTTCGVLISLANFMAVLDMTIANVSISTIAGTLAISPTEGTYVITSYAVAEAIAVPLTSWLVKRFGIVHLFVVAMFFFGIFSLLCGLANSLKFLIVARILQGLSGGLLLPLTQTLLMMVYPPEKRSVSLALWSITTLIAPVLGPVVGGYICDEISWPYIFYINVPLAIISSVIIAKILLRFETPKVKEKTDFIGLVLLIIWVAPLQIMLDEGRELDWFNSDFIIILAITAIIGFIVFIIWELTEKKPIVNLRVFRHRGYSACIITMALAFGCYFGILVVVPLWLQNFMGYTSTWSGIVSGSIGILSIAAAPFAAKLAVKHDIRMIVCFAVFWLGLLTFIRSFAATNMTIEQIIWPMIIQGASLPLFFLPLTHLSLACVDKEEMIAAAGLMTFSRTLSGAFATSLVTTAWEQKTKYFHAELTNVVNFPPHQHPVLIENMVQQQSVMLATNYIFVAVAIIFAFAALAIWIAPKSAPVADMPAVH